MTWLDWLVPLFAIANGMFFAHHYRRGEVGWTLISFVATLSGLIAVYIRLAGA